MVIDAIVCHLIKQLKWFGNILHFYAVLWMAMSGVCALATSPYFNIYSLLFLIWLFIPRTHYMTIDLKWWPSITLIFYFSFFAAGNVTHLYFTLFCILLQKAGLGSSVWFWILPTEHCSRSYVNSKSGSTSKQNCKGWLQIRELYCK